MSKAKYFALLLSFGIMASAPAWAREGEGNDKKHDKKERHGKHNKVEARSHFIDDDRSTVQNFYKQNPSSLPPGLAKRGGNLPPGLAKRGGKLPPGLARGQLVTPEYHEHLLPLPPKLELLLPPPPHEVIRRILERDIVMIHKQTNKVLDVMHDALPH